MRDEIAELQGVLGRNSSTDDKAAVEESGRQEKVYEWKVG